MGAAKILKDITMKLNPTQRMIMMIEQGVDFMKYRIRGFKLNDILCVENL